MSEVEAKSELDIARRSYDAVDLSKSTCTKGGAGVSEVRPIERIEELRPKLNALALGNPKSLIKRKVKIRQAGSTDNARPGSPESVLRRSLKGGGIEPLLDRCSPAGAGLVIGITNQIGPR